MLWMLWSISGLKLHRIAMLCARIWRYCKEIETCYSGCVLNDSWWMGLSYDKTLMGLIIYSKLYMLGGRRGKVSASLSRGGHSPQVCLTCLLQLGALPLILNLEVVPKYCRIVPRKCTCCVCCISYPKAFFKNCGKIHTP